MSDDLPRPWRVPLLILGMLSLAGGATAGLIRIGWNAPLPGAASVLDHAPLMIGAFFGTVIGLERAVALGARWAYGAPLATGFGGLALLAGVGTGAALIAAGSLIFLTASARVYLRQRARHTLTLVLGAAAALVLLSAGGIVAGTAGYDAGLHAVLLGFVFAMVFGHAPIIFPAILGVRLPYHALAYAPLLVLHVSVAVRVAGTLAGAAPLRATAGLLHAAALVLFVLGVLAAVIRGRRAGGA
jgi:hypothetical protein